MILGILPLADLRNVDVGTCTLESTPSPSIFSSLGVRTVTASGYRVDSSTSADVHGSVD
jgi:hypothetical protein